MPFYPFYDPLYFIIALPALLLGLYAQYKVRATFDKYSRIRNARGITGVRAAEVLLAATGLSHVNVEGIPGNLGDHYDPRSKTLRLSRSVALRDSVAAVGVVAHEVGHAIQDSVAYAPLRVRNSIVPAVSLGSWLGPILFILGFLTANRELATIGVIGFSGAAVFALVTLPVELNASSRALRLLQSTGLLVGNELQGAREVLNAAALTYIAALAQSISTLLYYFLLLSGSRRD